MRFRPDRLMTFSMWIHSINAYKRLQDEIRPQNAVMGCASSETSSSAELQTEVTEGPLFALTHLTW